MESSTGFEIVGIAGPEWSESELQTLSEELSSEVGDGFTSVVIGAEMLMRVFDADDRRQLMELGLTNLDESEVELPSSPEATSIPFAPEFVPPDLIPWITGWGAALLLHPEDTASLPTEGVVEALDAVLAARDGGGSEPIVITVRYPGEAGDPSFYRAGGVPDESTG